jgi:glucose/mannose-6-phosphate isomerase
MNSRRRTKRSPSSKVTENQGSRKRSSWEERIRTVDPSDLRSDFGKWPSLARERWTQTIVPTFDAGNYNRIVLVGMGGSLLSGELLVDLAREQKSSREFETVKDYHLPSYCDERTLVIGMSSSGNTEETLSVLSEARKKGLKGFAFGSGGSLESLSKDKWGFDFIQTTMLKVPRSSLPGIFYPVLKLLVTNHVLEFTEQEVIESIDALEEINREDSKRDNRALRLAKDLISENSDSFPLVYASSRTRAVGLRFRQSLNENSKIHSFNGEIPELCHNEIVGWDFLSSSIKNYRTKNSKSKQICMLLRLQEDDPPEIRTRFDIVADLVNRSKGNVLEAPHVGRGYLARTLSMLYLLDYSTYYAAILRGVDPIKTPSISLLKQELASRLDFVSHL